MSRTELLEKIASRAWMLLKADKDYFRRYAEWKYKYPLVDMQGVPSIREEFQKDSRQLRWDIKQARAELEGYLFILIQVHGGFKERKPRAEGGRKK